MERRVSALLLSIKKILEIQTFQINIQLKEGEEKEFFKNQYVLKVAKYHEKKTLMFYQMLTWNRYQLLYGVCVFMSIMSSDMGI